MGKADDPKTMIENRKIKVVPRLRTAGFKGSFPHFRRERGGGWDYLSFQFDRYGGGFAIEIGKRPGGEKPYPPDTPDSKVTAFHVSQRERLGTIESGTDRWFRYDGPSRLLGSRRFSRLATSCIGWIESEAVPWWG